MYCVMWASVPSLYNVYRRYDIYVYIQAAEIHTLERKMLTIKLFIKIRHLFSFLFSSLLFCSCSSLLK